MSTKDIGLFLKWQSFTLGSTSIMNDQLNQPIIELAEDQRHLSMSVHKKYLVIITAIVMAVALLAVWWFLSKLKPSDRYDQVNNLQSSLANPLLTDVP